MLSQANAYCLREVFSVTSTQLKVGSESGGPTPEATLTTAPLTVGPSRHGEIPCTDLGCAVLMVSLTFPNAGNAL